MEHPRQGFIPTSNGGSLILENRVNSLIEEQCVIEEGNRAVRLAKWLVLLRKEKTRCRLRCCPIARLLRACGQLQMDVILPEVLTTGRMRLETSWYALLEHIHCRVSEEMDSSDLGCITMHWTTIRKGFRSRGIRFPRQIVLDRTAESAEWLVPT